MSQVETYEKELIFQADKSRVAIDLIKTVSDLWYDKSIELVFFRNKLINKNVSEILNLHEYAADFVEKPISIFDLVEVAQAIKTLNLPPSKLDVGKLTYEYQLQDQDNPAAFVAKTLANAKNFEDIKPKDVVLYGFGRIGRLLARELMTATGKGSQLRLRAIVTRGQLNETVLEKRAALLRRDSVHGQFPGTVLVDVEKRAALLRRDSVHGQFPGTVLVDVENKSLIINGTTVHMITAGNPEDIDYEAYGINDALVIDNTGAFRSEEELGRHLKAKGISKVLLTAPGKEGVPNIVHGVNQQNFNPDEVNIFSAASCTTNAITPVLKVVEEEFGIKNGHLETIHAYTNDQNLVDNMHSKYRRGRAAALNMVITETGAGKAVAKALPSLDGKLSSNAIRVPVPNGSLAILNLNLEKATSVEEINNVIRGFALEGDLIDQIQYSTDNELVSSDIIGSSAPAIYDSKATIVSGEGKNVVLYVWYDNEYGYSHQVMRLAKHIAKVRRFTYY